MKDGRRISIITVVCVAIVIVWRVTALLAESASQSTDWALHNLDEFNSRYSPLSDINRTNVVTLALRWSFETDPAMRIAEMTPLVINGVMYFHSGSRLFAVDAMSGDTVWVFDAPEEFTGGGRGPAYGDGRIYAYGPSIMYAVAADTGTFV